MDSLELILCFGTCLTHDICTDSVFFIYNIYVVVFMEAISDTMGVVVNYQDLATSILLLPFFAFTMMHASFNYNLQEIGEEGPSSTSSYD